MSFVASLIGKKILAESVQNKFGTEDPYFEKVPATRLNGTPSGKYKKRKKALPPGISEHDAKVLTKVKRRAYRLDMCLFSCFGLRFGWGSVIGIIPGIGDVLDALLAVMVLRTCSTIEDGLPAPVRAKMVMNILLDFIIGIVPFLGDIVDAAFKANTRNAAVLEEHLREKGKKALRRSNMPIPEIDPSLPEEFDRLEHEAEVATSQPRAHEDMTTGVQGGRSGRSQGGGRESSAPSAPAATRARDQGSGSRRFFGRSRQPDVEMGGTDPAAASGSRKKQQRRS